MLPKDIKRYKSPDGADSVYGEVRDFDAQNERNAKTYRR
jgi:hypothetical protein